MTYGECLAYSVGMLNQPLPVGTLIKFPSATKFVVARPRLLAILPTSSSATVTQDVAATAKRPCIRQPGTGGELAEDSTDKPKGTLQYLLDLDGNKHFTRNKSELNQREKDLFFVFRAMDTVKWDYSISSDMVLQAEEYRSMINEQGDTRSGNRHGSFMSRG